MRVPELYFVVIRNLGVPGGNLGSPKCILESLMLIFCIPEMYFGVFKGHFRSPEAHFGVPGDILVSR